jgi:energy-coupling factor transporter ATP-binding protein EcfA2
MSTTYRTTHAIAALLSATLVSGCAAEVAASKRAAAIDRGAPVAADSGETCCSGVDLRTSTTQSPTEIRYLTQHFSHYGELTVRENLEFAAAMRGVSDSARAVELALHDFDLIAQQHRRAQTLSGGERQRQMLAAILLGNPQILLLDEPTAALDSNARSSFWRLLDRRRTLATTLILTTHLDEDAPSRPHLWWPARRGYRRCLCTDDISRQLT